MAFSQTAASLDTKQAEAGANGKLWQGLALLALTLALLVNWVAYVPPLQDFNEWVYQGFLLKDLLRGADTVAIVKHWPVPYVFSQIGIGALTYVFSPILAGKIFASIYLIAGGFVAHLLSGNAATTYRGHKFLLLVVLIVVNAPYWAGEINYQIGLLLVLVYINICPEDRQTAVLSDVWYTVLVFLCHAICLGILLIYMGWRALYQRRIFRGIAAVTPVLALLAWYVAADPRADYDPTAVTPALQGIGEYLMYKGYVLAKIGPYQNLVFGLGGDAVRFPLLFRVGCAVNLLMATSATVFCLIWLVRSVTTREIGPTLLTAVTCGIVAIIDPAKATGLANLGERFLYPALGIAVMYSRYGATWGRLGAYCCALLPVFLLNLLMLMPKADFSGPNLEHTAINNPAARYQLLFWHRPFLFADHITQAEHAAATGKPPDGIIAYQTSLLSRKAH